MAEAPAPTSGGGIGGHPIGALINDATQTGEDMLLEVTVHHRDQALHRRRGALETVRHAAK